MLASWVKETTTTTGTGTLTLSSVSNYVRFSQAFSVGSYAQYAILTSDNKYEAGIGKIGASNTLERIEILETFDGTTYDNTSPTALTLAAGTHEVICTTAGVATFDAAVKGVGDHDSIGSKIIASGHHDTSQSSNHTPTLARQFAQPFVLSSRITVAGIGVYVVTAGSAGATIDVGLYNINASGLPQKQLFSATGLATDATGLVIGSITPVTLNPGLYASVHIQLTATASLRGNVSPSNTPFLGVNSSGALVTQLRRDAVETQLDDPADQTSWVDSSSGTQSVPYIYLDIV